MAPLYIRREEVRVCGWKGRGAGRVLIEINVLFLYLLLLVDKNRCEDVAARRDFLTQSYARLDFILA